MIPSSSASRGGPSSGSTSSSGSSSVPPPGSTPSPNSGDARIGPPRLARPTAEGGPRPRSPAPSLPTFIDPSELTWAGAFEEHHRRSVRGLEIGVWLAEHQDLIDALPADLPPAHRNSVVALCRQLERDGFRWSALVEPDNSRPPRLEAAVNLAIANHGLDTRVLIALNAAFGLRLEPVQGWVPQLQEHMTALENLDMRDRRHPALVRAFLAKLEAEGLSMSTLAGDGADTDPPMLRAQVNWGIARKVYAKDTRAALNSAFGLHLTGTSVRLYPTDPDHHAMLEALPQGTDPRLKSVLNRLLCYLEQQGTRWADEVPRGDPAPQGLLRHIEAGIRARELNSGTRGTLDRIPGLGLQLSSRPQGNG